MNSVLSSIPTYWMSVFCLLGWVIKVTGRIRRDFLWTGPDIAHPGCRLVSWKNLCRSKDQGGWGILELASFNLALLGKWWWKFLMDPSWEGAKVVQFNYGLVRWNLHPLQTGRVSFFWKGVHNCLPALRNCLVKEPQNGLETLFWKDNWIIGWAPRYL